MSVGDVTKIPAAGIQLDFDITAVCGSTTTMYVGTSGGSVKSLTTSGVLAELTTKTRFDGKIVALCYVSSSLLVVLADGRVYSLGTDGSSKSLVKRLNMGVKAAYYYSNYLYLLLDKMQQEKSSACKLQVA